MHLALFKKIKILYGILHLIIHCKCSKLLWSGPNLVKITVMLYCVARVMSPDFLKKCQMQPISQDQWQIAKLILEFKSTLPKCFDFNRVRAGSIFFAIRLIMYNVICTALSSHNWISGYNCLWHIFGLPADRKKFIFVPLLETSTFIYPTFITSGCTLHWYEKENFLLKT